MMKFSQEKVLLLHQLIAQETGGNAGVRDYGLLESALESAYQTFDGTELFPSKEEKAAKLGFSLISNHAFIDGNKRIGAMALLVTLDMNHLNLHTNSAELSEIILHLASGELDETSFLKWVQERVE